jgi:ferredoxin--NADP+ reductase/benzoate/toluate 1,2-dioxygenase reductase subunit
VRIHHVVHVRDLSAGAFVLRFSREGLSFRAGQWINLGLPGSRDQREYTLYSSPADEFLEVLVKEIPEGAISRALRRRRPGDALEAEGPHGSFCLVEGRRRPPRFLFLATGTGISPFHSFTRSHPGLDYLLLHGVRSAHELYDRGVFDPARLVPCISGDADGETDRETAYRGRLTAYLREQPLESSNYCYLCGNSDMIYEAYAILRERGVGPSRIFAEVYF